MQTSNDFPTKDTSTLEGKMSGKRDFLRGQVFGVLLFSVGIAGGIIIGIFVNRGDTVVTCKNIPGWLSDWERTTKSPQTNPTSTPLPTAVVTDDSCDDCKKKKFVYAINNQLQEPYFYGNVTMDIVPHRPLIYYMEKAADSEGSIFTKFKSTYFSTPLGYFIDSINNLAGNFAANKTYWQILNYTDPLSLGVSSYIPAKGDNILFNFTVYTEDKFS